MNDAQYSTRLDNKGKWLVQSTVATFLYYAHAVETPILVALSNIGTQDSAHITKAMMEIDWLLDFLSYHPNAKVRYTTVTTMAKKASTTLLPLLTQTLENESVDQIRLQALEGMAKVKNESCVPALNRIITYDANSHMRGKALELVDELGSKNALAAVSNMLLNDTDPALRFKAIDVALGIGGKDAAPYFRKAVINEENEVIRNKTLQILFYLNPQMAEEAKVELQKKYY